jgi:hypothetical protein
MKKIFLITGILMVVLFSRGNAFALDHFDWKWTNALEHWNEYRDGNTHQDDSEKWWGNPKEIFNFNFYHRQFNSRNLRHEDDNFRFDFDRDCHYNWGCNHPLKPNVAPEPMGMTLFLLGGGTLMMGVIKRRQK